MVSQAQLLTDRLLTAPRAIWDSGLTCSFLACLIFSFSGLFVKLTAGRVPVLEVCLVRSSISIGLSLILMQVSGMPWRQWFGQRQHLKLLVARGVCGACSMTTYYVALFLLPLGDAVTINLIGPPVTAIFARVFLKEPLGRRGLAGCVISVAGVILVARPPFLFGGHEEWARARSIGTAAGVLSAVLGGGSSMTIRLIGGSEPAAVIAIWFHTATTLLSVVPLLAGKPNKPVLLSHYDGGLMLGVAATSFVAQLLSTRGLQRCQAAKAAAMGFTQVVYSHIMGAIFFGDKLTVGGFLGALLILSGVLLVTMRSSGSSATAKQGVAGAAAVKAAAAKGQSDDSDAAALLPDSHLQSHLPTAADGEVADAVDSAAAVAVVQLSSSSSLPQKLAPRSSLAGQSSQELSQQPTAAAAAAADQAPQACAPESGLLAQLAASAAAALGGELCPAGSTAMGLELSRQVSCQLASSLSWQPSLQSARTLSAFATPPSAFMTPSSAFMTPASAFMTPPGLPAEWLMPAQQQQQMERAPLHQASLQHSRLDEPAGRQQQQQEQAQAADPELKRALLPTDSAPGSPTSSCSPERLLPCVRQQPQ